MASNSGRKQTAIAFKMKIELLKAIDAKQKRKTVTFGGLPLALVITGFFKYQDLHMIIFRDSPNVAKPSSFITTDDLCYSWLPIKPEQFKVLSGSPPSSFLLRAKDSFENFSIKHI
ncbi:hypothetical protein TNCV_4788481 [Trichonephila clavipes]|nr:hypothetical protein TNCV_4788481 [Trichonephila clavipes]